jgi:diguanylate cyclase (GGDEF)-like protein/PAS domain S-box-containing protein
VFGAVGLLVLVGYLWLPRSVQGVTYVLVSAAAAVAAVIAAARCSGRARLVWALFAAAQSSYAVADACYSFVSISRGGVPLPSMADAFYLAFYPLAGLALILLSRPRHGLRRWDAVIDALVAGTAAAMVLWILLRPAIFATDAGLGAQLVSLAYPAGDLVLLVLAIRLVLGPGHRSPALVLLIASLSATIVADLVYAVIAARSGEFGTGGVVDLLWLAGYIAFAMAALHPSRSLIAVQEERPAVLTRRRAGLLVAAGLLPAVVLGYSLLINERVDLVLLVAGTSTLYVLLLARAVGLAREQARATQRERIVREAGAVLVTASTAPQIYGAGLSAAQHLLGHRYRVDVSPRVDPGPTADTSDRTVIALAGQARQHGALTVRGAQPVPVEVRSSLTALAAQVTLALDAALRREQRYYSERRFRSIMQSSSDVMFVLRPDLTVAWCSDSVESISGYTVDELSGTRLLTLVHPDDEQVAGRFSAALEQPGSASRAEIRLRVRDGSYRVFDVTGRNLVSDPAVGGLVVTGSDITERRALEEELRTLALRDQLTGLGNRARLVGSVRRSLRERPPADVAVIFIDLDDFRTVNDSLGHETGDQLLRQVADRLRRGLWADAPTARLGGDEFAVLLDDADKQAALTVGTRIRDILGAPFAVDGQEVFVRASIGVATAEGVGTAETVLRNADMAMHQAKTAGKDRVELFEPRMHAEAVRRLELHRDLRRALDNEEFVLHYQPAIDLASGQLTGFEALLRWQHPTQGLIQPDEFVPLAEATGLIVPLGRWILAEACLQACKWRDQFGPTLTMSVNVSVRQVEGTELLSDVAAALDATGLAPAGLVLELTESAFAVDLQSTVEKLRELDARGIRLAIDDFGTGYSSLRYIKQFPVRELKIDRSFVSALENTTSDLTLVTLIIDLARSLQMSTVAEGIETQFQMDTMRDLGCTLGQGYLFSPPNDVATIETAIRNGSFTPWRPR